MDFSKLQDMYAVTREQQRVATLEAEVRMLSAKAVESADRLADYEEEIRNLKVTNQQHHNYPRNDSPLENHSLYPAPPVPLSRNSSTTSSRFAFLTRTSSLPVNAKPLPNAPVSMAPSPAISELQAALAAETQKRINAERKLQEVEGELEDLSATLFEQANEMVATERREKAQLVEKVRELEERREKGERRLEMVEGSLKRLERVKRLLNER